MEKHININDTVKTLINGGTVWSIPDKDKKEVKRRLREIKKNCTEVLSQLKNGYQL